MTTNVAPVVLVEPCIDDDSASKTPGRLMGIDYRLNDTLLFLSADVTRPPLIYVFGREDMELDVWQAGVREAQTLIDSPEVQQALTERATRAKLSPAANALIDAVTALPHEDAQLVIDFLRSCISTDENERIQAVCLLSKLGLYNAARKVARTIPTVKA